MPDVRPSPNPPELRVVRRRTVDLDPDAAPMARDSNPAGENGAAGDRPGFLGIRSHAHVRGMFAALLVVLWLAFTFLPNAW